MTIAVASGKGGAGKTLVATALAAVLSRSRDVDLLDLDVEEPNAHLFFDLPLRSTEAVWGMIPEIDAEHCTHCGVCQRICAYHALLQLADSILVFPELCKGCRGCIALCPEGAISTGSKLIGELETREAGALRLVTGRLRIGETDAPALIRDVKRRGSGERDVVILDAPPGTSCSAVEAVRGAGYTLLVAESTPFGLHDLELMVATLRAMKNRFGVIINKAVPHDQTVREYCMREEIDVIAELPYSIDIARACAQGRLVPDAMPSISPLFESIFDAVLGKQEVTV